MARTAGVGARGTEAAAARAKGATGGGLAEDLLLALRGIDRALRLKGARRTRAGQSTTAAEQAVLACLAAAPTALRLGTLAERLHRDASSVSVVTSRLTARGLIRKRSSDEDHRARALTVTAAGRRAVERAPDDARTVVAGVLAKRSRADAVTVLTVLGALAAALSTPRSHADTTPVVGRPGERIRQASS